LLIVVSISVRELDRSHAGRIVRDHQRVDTLRLCLNRIPHDIAKVETDLTSHSFSRITLPITPPPRGDFPHQKTLSAAGVHWVVIVRTFEKRYVVPEEIGRKFAFSIGKYSGTFNQRKMGRNRRGMVMFLGARGSQREDGKFEIALQFVAGRSMFAKVVDGPRFKMYEFADFRKPLRMLALADSSR
jgi:hypothetical protein